MLELRASKREKTGTYIARKTIKEGLIPATIQNSKQGTLNIKINSLELEKIYQTGFIFSRLFKINLDDSAIEVVVRKIDFHPVTDKIIHLDFIDCTNLQEVRIFAKIKFINKDKSIGLKKGGFLNIRKRLVPLVINKDLIPDDYIKIDITNLSVGDKLRLADIIVPEGGTIPSQKDDLVASITGRGIKNEDQENSEEGESEENEEKS